MFVVGSILKSPGPGWLPYLTVPGPGYTGCYPPWLGVPGLGGVSTLNIEAAGSSGPASGGCLVLVPAAGQWSPHLSLTTPSASHRLATDRATGLLP